MVAVSTFPDRASALAMGRRCVEKGLVLCAQCEENLTSIYAWEGEVCEDKECKLTLKLREDQLEACEAELLAHHPYDTPQWLVWPVTRVSDGYAEWAKLNAEEKS